MAVWRMVLLWCSFHAFVFDVCCFIVKENFMHLAMKQLLTSCIDSLLKNYAPKNAAL